MKPIEGEEDITHLTKFLNLLRIGLLKPRQTQFWNLAVEMEVF